MSSFSCTLSTNRSDSTAARCTLQNLPQNLQKEIFTYLPCKSALSLSFASRTIRNSGQQVAQASQPLAALQCLAGYRSPSVPGDIARERVDTKIERLTRAIRRLRRAIRAADAPQPDANANVAAMSASAPKSTLITAKAKRLKRMEKAVNILEASKLPNDRFPPHVLNLIAEYDFAAPPHSFRPEYPLTSFSPDKWNRYIGRVNNVPIPPGIQAKLLKPCPVFKNGKTVGETHTLNYIPPKVDGQPLTLNRFLAYIQNTKNGGKSIKLNIHWKQILKTYGDMLLTPGWFLMLKTCLPGTKNKTYPEQQAVLKEFQRTNPQYREPSGMEAAVSILTEYIQSGDSGTRLFSDEYTRISDVLKGYSWIVGGFDPGGPSIYSDYDFHAEDDVGLGVLLPCGITQASQTLAAFHYLADYRSPSAPGDIARERVDTKIERLTRAIRAAYASQPDANANPAAISAAASASQPTLITAKAPLEQQAKTKRLEQMEKTVNILEASKLPNDGFPPHVLNLLAAYVPSAQSFHPEYPPTSFSPDKWNRYIGRVRNGPVPPDIQAKLLRPCPVFKGKTVGETHVLYYIPLEVDAEPLTLNRFLAYIQNTKNGGKSIKLNIYHWKKLLKTYGDMPLTPGWFLMLKTCLPGTKNKTYPEQQAVLKEFQRTNPKYREPNGVEAAVSILMEYIQSGDSDTRLFIDEYTRTSDVLKGYGWIVGCFTPSGPFVLYDHHDEPNVYIGLSMVLPCGSSPATPSP